eukprot:667514-Prymnesium_polylepis.1
MSHVGLRLLGVVLGAVDGGLSRRRSDAVRVERRDAARLVGLLEGVELVVGERVRALERIPRALERLRRLEHHRAQRVRREQRRELVRVREAGVQLQQRLQQAVREHGVGAGSGARLVARRRNGARDGLRREAARAEHGEALGD